MNYPTIEQQLYRLNQDKKHFQQLKKTDPLAAQRLARTRLQRAGIINDQEEFTPDFLAAWTNK